MAGLHTTNRRQFLKHAGMASTVLATSALSYSRVYGANSKVNLASIGTGGKGWSDLSATAASPHAQVVALCDVDESKAHLGRAAEAYPQATLFTDWRSLLDASQDIDAVIVSTPDHMHAPVSLAAMQLGKHVQCQKPLTHTVFEARQMRLAAKKHNVVTQMGNQIQSHEAYRTAVQLIHDGVIGKVREVHSWQSGGMGWMLVDDRPSGSEPIPDHLHWDHWLGVAAERPYLSKIYHAFSWRAWQAFSNGQLGDFGCHILDPVSMALQLTAPMTIRAEAPPINREIWAKSSTVQYEFPGTERTAGQTIRVTWYDGEGHFPPREALGLPQDYQLPGSGSVLIGELGQMVLPHVGMPKLFPEEKFAEFEIPVVAGVDHYTSWVDACRGEGVATSHFDYSGPLSETVLLGTIAIRLPGETLRWEAADMKLTGSPRAAAMLTKPYRAGWEPSWIDVA